MMLTGGVNFFRTTVRFCRGIGLRSIHSISFSSIIHCEHSDPYVRVFCDFVNILS